MVSWHMLLCYCISAMPVDKRGKSSRCNNHTMINLRCRRENEWDKELETKEGVKSITVYSNNYSTVVVDSRSSRSWSYLCLTSFMTGSFCSKGVADGFRCFCVCVLFISRRRHVSLLGTCLLDDNTIQKYHPFQVAPTHLFDIKEERQHPKFEAIVERSQYVFVARQSVQSPAIHSCLSFLCQRRRQISHHARQQQQQQQVYKQEPRRQSNLRQLCIRRGTVRKIGTPRTRHVRYCLQGARSHQPATRGGPQTMHSPSPSQRWISRHHFAWNSILAPMCRTWPCSRIARHCRFTQWGLSCLWILVSQNDTTFVTWRKNYHTETWSHRNDSHIVLQQHALTASTIWPIWLMPIFKCTRNIR